MIKFDDFFKEAISKGKVKFNMNAGDKNLPALDFLLSDSDRWMEMNCWKSKQANNNYSDAEYVLSFAQYYPYGSNYYMFGGLYKIEKIIPEVYDQIGYKLTLQNEFKEYIKRLIIKLDRPVGRDIYNKPFEKVCKEILILKYMKLHLLLDYLILMDLIMYCYYIKIYRLLQNMKLLNGKMH